MFVTCPICKGRLLYTQDGLNIALCACKTGWVCEYELRRKKQLDDLWELIEGEDHDKLR